LGEVVGEADLVALGRALPVLAEHGRRLGPFMPWHRSEEPYHWFVAECLLRLTTRKAASQAFTRLTEAYPNWESLASAGEAEIAGRIASAGLAKQRSRQLRALARTVDEEMGGAIPFEREALLRLPGVGPYVADAILLYFRGEGAFPLDGNIQRVFRRVSGLPMPEGKSRRTDPYRDSWLRGAADFALERHPQEGLVDLHRGVLDVGWTTCRYRPNPPSCPVREVCAYARTRYPAS
jgi:A/G-specific adenine glycosylase